MEYITSHFVLLFIVPLIIVISVLALCKYFNFSMLPADLQGKPFKIPKIKRKRDVKGGYTWKVENNI
jgi:predicted membrane metal-binding protein